MVISTKETQTIDGLNFYVHLSINQQKQIDEKPCFSRKKNEHRYV